MMRKTISMPDAMAKYIDKRVKAGQYGNDSEYIRDLIRRDQEERETIAAIQAAVDEDKGGVSGRTVSEIFEEALRLEAKKRKKA